MDLGMAVELLVILLVLLIAFAILGIPHPRYGVWPGGVLTAVLIVLLILILLGVIE